MTISMISGVRIKGIACAVPERVRSIDDDAKIFGGKDVHKISESTGVNKRHISKNICTSDLCYAAAEKLIQESGLSRDSIDTLVFVSQTPDYVLPATSCSLHHRLKLAKSCASFDMNLGCSGFVYGLWLCSNLIKCGSSRRALLLAGDTISRITSPQDRSTALLFGDAGSATLLEHDENSNPMIFNLGTDGEGQKSLVVPAGGLRKNHSAETSMRIERENGNIRSEEDLFMDGPEVFSFTLREVPPLIFSLLSESGFNKETVDYFIFHQANQFILNYLTKRMKLSKDKVIIAMKNFGNTSSASIPLTILTSIANQLKENNVRMILAGFGVGYSWGGVALSCGNMDMPELIIVPEKDE